MSVGPLAVLDAVAGASLLAVAALAWRRRRTSSVLLVLAAASWFATSVLPSLALLHRPFLLGAVLMLPGRRLSGPLPLALLVVSGLGVVLPPGAQPWLALATAGLGLAVASAPPLRRPGGKGSSPEEAAARTSLVVLSVGMALPVVERVVWPRYADAGLPVATYLCAVVLCSLTLSRGLLGRRIHLAETVIELSASTPSQAVDELRALSRQETSNRRRRSLESAVAMVEENARLHESLAGRIREVRASRARLVEAGHEERRRLEQSLANGAQRYLDDLDLCLRSSLAFTDSDPGFAGCLAELHNTRGDLAQIAQGLHPRLLSEQGLAAALQDLSRRSPVPLEVRVPAGRFPASTEEALWYACAEAVANVWKHSAATSARVCVTDLGDAIRATIEDDGAGGASVGGTGGLPGLVDRLGAVDGRLRLSSTPAGTTLDVTVPLS